MPPAPPTPRPYHHGNLRRALIDAALEEIEASGPAGLNLREIARRAGVSHAAPAHHFGDKAGVFTAIAAEGFALLSAATSEAAGGENALLGTALAYIQFSVSHRAHFEVMWRPDLYRHDDPDLAAGRQRTFDVFYRTVASSTPSRTPEEFSGAVVAAWAVVHGFSSLWLSGNLAEMGDDPLAVALMAGRGLVEVAEATARQLPPA